MKRWEKYDKLLFSGDWHVHTRYTHGKNTVFEMCRKAEELGLRLIVFAEHVDQQMPYRFENFLVDVYSAKDRFNLVVLAGCEARIMDINGNLNVRPEIIRQCEIVLGAFHAFPLAGKYKRLHALEMMLKNPDIDVWAHPSTLYKAGKVDFKLTHKEKTKTARWCKENNVLFEDNSKYPVDKEFNDIINRNKVVTCRSSSAHSMDELVSGFNRGQRPR